MEQYTRILYFLFFFVSLKFCSSSSFPSFSANMSLHLCSHYDRLALIEFKSNFSLNINASLYCPTSYPKTKSWKEGRDCCSWDGVTCDTVTGRVIGLDLSCSLLHGSIYSNNSLFRLSHLQKLNLAGNNFSDSKISPEFGQFKSLTYLNLSDSSFLGEVPSEISPLFNLISLDISNNQLMIADLSLKRLVQNCSLLKQFLFVGVNLSSIDKNSLMNPSSSLTDLSFNDCQLQGKFPSSILYLPHLRILDLSGNERLNIHLPKSKWSSPLQELHFDWVPFTGELLESIGDLNSLKQLTIYSCNFTGSIPKSIGNLLQLTHFHGGGNNFDGRIPSSLYKIAMMKSEEGSVDGKYLGAGFVLYQDSVLVVMKGQERQLVRIIKTLKTLDFSNNKFRGEIPKLIGKCTHLKGLTISHNSIGGGIPSSLGYLRDIEWLDLSSNRLTGKIPEELTGLTFFSHLNLSHNKLVGPIPRSTQFDTFDNSSYKGNIGLCGFPLSKTCGNNGAPPQSQPVPSEENHSGSEFDWKIIMMGYSSGLIMRLSLGYIMLVAGKPEWLVRLIEGMWLKQVKRQNERERRSRNN